MAALLLRLAAPLQAWGSQSKFEKRTTEREPTKSGVIGMIAAAMGMQRNGSNELLETLSSLRFGVRVEREGRLTRDFHMARGAVEKNTHVTERYYLADAVFLVVLESEDSELLGRIEKALKNPVYPLFLGRRSCPPTLPIVLGMRDNEMADILRDEPEICNRCDVSRRIVYDCADDGVMVNDAPVSFSQRHRIYGKRMKREEILYAAEHDPFSEL